MAIVHRAGPWPGWLKWYRATGGWARDAKAWEMHAAGASFGQIARALGCSPSTAWRGVTRQAQRMYHTWPPPVSNNFNGQHRLPRVTRRPTCECCGRPISPSRAAALRRKAVENRGSATP